MRDIFDQFMAAVKKFPQRCAIAEGDRIYTYSDLLETVDRCANNLMIKCSEARPRVAMLSGHCVDYVVISLAVAKIGGSFIPVNINLKEHQIEKVFRSALVNLVVCDGKLRCDIESVSFDDLLSENPSLCDPKIEWYAQKDFLITLSSGSTGDPKPIAISQRQKAFRAKQTIDHFHLTSDDTILCASPFFHSLGQRLIFVGLLNGSTVVTLSRFNAEAWCQCVEHFNVSFTISVPTQIYSVFDFVGEEFERISSLKHLVSSSAPIDRAFKDRVFIAAGIQFSEIYGATEVAVVSLLKHDMVDKSNTVGRVCSGVEVVIVGETGKEVPYGEIGEIRVKSDYSFDGYFNGEFGLVCEDRYFKTGDLGYLDEDGFLVFMGRIKDVIFCGGANVYPKDVESVLMTSDFVHDCSVFALPVYGYGEVVGAVCEVVPGCDFVEVELSLRRLCNQKLAAFQRPIRYHFSSDIPRTAVGKIDKMAIREEFGQVDFELGGVVKHLIG